MILYIFIAAVVILMVFVGFWSARWQKKRVLLAEEFFASPAIKALLDSGFTKDVDTSLNKDNDDGISGMINDYPAGVYAWFDTTGTRYFTYLRFKRPAGFSVYSFSEKYRTEERVRVYDINTIRQEIKQIDGETIAKSFTRLQEIAAIEKLEPFATS